MSRDEVVELISECGLDEFRQPILAAIRPAYRIESAPDGPHRIGGLPEFTAGEDWPRDERGVAHTLVAQIDCGRLPSLSREFPQPEWGHGGALLRVFAALDARVEDFSAVGLACSPDAPLTRAREIPSYPADLNWDFDDYGEFVRVLEEQTVQFEPTLTAMVNWTAGLTDPDDYDYWTFRTRLFLGGRPLEDEESSERRQLLGHADTNQGEDPRSYADFPHGHPNDWGVLINVHDIPDVSYLSIVSPIEDLATGRYDRLVADARLT